MKYCKDHGINLHEAESCNWCKQEKHLNDLTITFTFSKDSLGFYTHISVKDKDEKEIHSASHDIDITDGDGITEAVTILIEGMEKLK